MTNLKNILELLKIEAEQHQNIPYNYVIPKLWDYFNLIHNKIELNNNEIIVNPYYALIETIKWILTQSESEDNLSAYYKTHQLNIKAGNWIQSSVIYSMLVRTSTSYDHDRSGQLETNNLYNLKDTGTFLKSLFLLPYLKAIGIEVIYLLPIFKYSQKNKKGEIGSPYATADFFELDENLFDPIAGNTSSLKQQFKAFSEACHILDLKLVIDIVPRTNSVDSNYLLSHPEWFYWIKKSSLKDYRAPQVSGIAEATVPYPKFMEIVLADKNVQKHLSFFVENPKDQLPERWAEMLAYQKLSPTLSPLELIEKFFDVTVAYAFSDNINDKQPAWTDVTYFRLFLDHPTSSLTHLKTNRLNPAPYLLFDTAKSSLNPGKVPNQALWNLLSDVLPYYQTEFGIDGARIDMGHALPKALIKQIMNKCLEENPNFTLIAEELDPNNAANIIKQGYHLLVGNGFTKIPYLENFGLHDFVYNSKDVQGYVLASGESHDTPRLAAFSGKNIAARLITLLSYFIPKTVPFINSGQELFEVAPMNLGLGARENEQFLLPKNHPFYGKLALFDNFSFDYQNPASYILIEELKLIAKWRKKFLKSLLNLKKSHYLFFDHPKIPAIALGIERQKEVLLVVAHTDCFNDNKIKLHLNNLPERFHHSKNLQTVFPNNNNKPLIINSNNIIELDLKAGDFQLILLKENS